jgi:hypothetical protein
MQRVLSDHNCEGQAEAIFTALRRHGFIPLVPIVLVKFRDVELDISADDKEVWQFCQENGDLLLTGNRTASDGARSLEYTIRHYFKEDSLPVITIGNLDRVMTDPTYCWRCAENLVEIVLDLDSVRGTPRLYIPGRAVDR